MDTKQLNTSNVTQKAPLLEAISSGQVEIAKELISKLDKEQLNQGVDNFKKTPLHYAAEKGYLEIAQALIDKGVDKHAKDKGNSTPIAYATTKEMKTLLSTP